MPVPESAIEITDAAFRPELVVRDTCVDQRRTSVVCSRRPVPGRGRRAMELHALLAGAMTLAVARHTVTDALAAKEAARHVLAATEPSTIGT